MSVVYVVVAVAYRVVHVVGLILVVGLEQVDFPGVVVVEVDCLWVVLVVEGEVHHVVPVPVLPLEPLLQVVVLVGLRHLAVFLMADDSRLVVVVLSENIMRQLF